MNPDQTAQMRRLVWIHAGLKRIKLVLSWRGSILLFLLKTDCIIPSAPGLLNFLLYIFTAINTIIATRARRPITNAAIAPPLKPLSESLEL
jgi:hypothetical protein